MKIVFLFLGLSVSLSSSQPPLSFVASPFYFVCQHEQQESSRRDIALTLMISGEPEFYEPGKIYQVTLSAASPFDGLLVTGVQALSPQFTDFPTGGLAAAVGGRQDGGLCSLIYSHQSRRPQTRSSFFWQAPPQGTGCVEFIVTLMKNMKLVLNAVKVFKICEEEEEAATLPSLTTVGNSWVALRETFEDEEKTGKLSNRDGNSSRVCPRIGHGETAVLCAGEKESYWEYQNITLDGAGFLEFWAGKASCREQEEIGVLEVSIAVFSDGVCTVYDVLAEIQVLDHRSFYSLPLLADITVSLCLQLKPFGSCIAVDDILVYSKQEDVTVIFDTFEPLDLINWSTYTGVAVGRECDSSSPALTFTPAENSRSFAVTRDIRIGNETTVIQLLANLHCGNSTDFGMTIEFSVDGGVKWGKFGEEFGGDRLTVDSVDRWERLTLLLPPVDEAFLRVKFEFEGAQGRAAIDSVFVGKCSGCNNHGSCLANGTCRCDIGYSGLDCGVFDSDSPTTFREDFQKSLRNSEVIAKAAGVGTGYSCGILSRGRAAILNGAGSFLETFEFNGLADFTMKAVLLSGCGDDTSRSDKKIGVFATCNGGIQWRKLQDVHGRDFLTPSQLTIPSSEYTTCPLLRFRLVNLGTSAWAVDDWIFDQSEIETVNRLIDGVKSDFCGRSDVFVFPATNRTGTASYEIGPVPVENNFILNFGLVLGCGRGSDNGQVALEFSVDHGIRWNPVLESCFESSCYGRLWDGSVFHSEQFGKWEDVYIHLPYGTRSPHTKFRWTMKDLTFINTWALCSVYIGPDCPSSCSGHGYCTTKGCICHKGFGGVNCGIASDLSNHLTENFDTPELKVYISGGIVAQPLDGTVFSGSASTMNGTSVREVETRDVSLASVDFVFFFLKAVCSERTDETATISLLFSPDGGIGWSVFQELWLREFCTPRLVQLCIPASVNRDRVVRFKWWQNPPAASAPVWQIDHILIQGQRFGGESQPLGLFVDHHSAHWLARTASYISEVLSKKSALVFSGTEDVSLGILHGVGLTEESAISFEICVGCVTVSADESPVLFECSIDDGRTWSLVQEGCYPTDDKKCDEYLSPSIYSSEANGTWRRVTIFPSANLQNRDLLIRWRQSRQNGVETFALSNVYFGLPCPNLCSGVGLCDPSSMECVCDEGFSGSSCEVAEEASLPSLFEDFENEHAATFQEGGGFILQSNAANRQNQFLNFSLERPRFLVSQPVNLSAIRFVKFLFGSVKGVSVVLDVSVTNGQTWIPLEVLTSSLTAAVELPLELKSPRALVRLWEPSIEGSIKTWWTLDNFQLVHDVFLTEFRSNVSSLSETWSEVRGLPMLQESTIVFGGKNTEKTEVFAWTHAFEITRTSSLQFDLMIGPTREETASVRLEVTSNFGRSWNLLQQSCLPSSPLCANYKRESIFEANEFQTLRRVTIPVPKVAGSSKVSFRFYASSERVDWTLKEVILSHRCPWMCSGKGYCVDGICRCDKGYVGPYCVASQGLKLPDELHESFDSEVSFSNFQNVIGGHVGRTCGVLAGGPALVFDKFGTRLVETQDLDLGAAVSLQMHIKFGCLEANNSAIPVRDDGILLQYSTNGGAQWLTLQEVTFVHGLQKLLVLSLSLDENARTNSTRLRVWQPSKPARGSMVWSIDNFMITSHSIRGQSVGEDFQTGFSRNLILYYTGGKVENYCSLNSTDESLVFSSANVERQVVTRDVYVEEDTVLQFEIRVGCRTSASVHHPVRLEVSTNYGNDWRLLKADWIPPFLFFANQDEVPKRMLVKLRDVGLFGFVRFRWYQHVPSEFANPSSWSLDNLYVGFSCPEDCNGHGRCGPNTECFCDEGYSGATCERVDRVRPSKLREAFEEHEMDRKMFPEVSGGAVSNSCGKVGVGTSLVFSGKSTRLLMTEALDLTNVRSLQFFVKLDCSPYESLADAVDLHYTSNGGVTWKFLKRIDGATDAQLLVLDLPLDAQKPAVNLRWWQPQARGAWALDEIRINSMSGSTKSKDSSSVQPVLWSYLSGSSVQEICKRNTSGIVFSGASNVREAISNDFDVSQNTVLQFELSSSCDTTDSCFGVSLDFSSDSGRTWSPLTPQTGGKANPREPYTSDIYFGRRRTSFSLAHLFEFSPIRIRWSQPTPYLPSQSWALSHVYIGDDCPTACSNHGSCLNAECICDQGWENDDCSHPVELLLAYVWDSFGADVVSKSYWNRVVGASIMEGVDGNSLRFHGGCSRYLETVPLDFTASSPLLQFQFEFLSSGPRETNDDEVLLEFSLGGGSIWTNLERFRSSSSGEQRLINVILPTEARVENVILRLWQPTIDLHNKRGEWVVSNIRFGAPVFFLDSITNGFADDGEPNNLLWTKYSQAQAEVFRNSSAFVLKSRDKLPAYIETVDLIGPFNNSIVQFEYSASVNTRFTSAAPVRFEFSRDHGKTWQLVQDECLSGLQCPTPTLATIHEGLAKWRRVTVQLDPAVFKRIVRFRFHQSAKSSANRQWGIRQFYVGPACPAACSNQGTCSYPSCNCDEGFSGNGCEASVTYPFVFHDNFSNSAHSASVWSAIVGGVVASSHGGELNAPALVFSSSAQRFAETVPLDLRKASFLLLTAAVSCEADCSVELLQREARIYIHCSENGGITWNFVKVFKVGSVLEEYSINLPRYAQRRDVKIRVWEPESGRNPGISLVLDNIYVGGKEVNPVGIYEDFRGNDDDSTWIHLPYGQRTDDDCDNGTFSGKLWQHSQESITTVPLIVGEDFILEFGVYFSCVNPSTCNNDSIRLEYRTSVFSKWLPIQNGVFFRSEFESGTVTRILRELESNTHSGSTQFRWIQYSGFKWGLEYVYIGERCSGDCSNRGTCAKGNCNCQRGFEGSACQVGTGLDVLSGRLLEDFESSLKTPRLIRRLDGEYANRCSPLDPLGRNTYSRLGSCARSQLETYSLNASRFSDLLFVTRYVNLSNKNCAPTGDDSSSTVVLQFSIGNTFAWKKIDEYSSEDFSRARKISAKLPSAARSRDVRFRWVATADTTSRSSWVFDNIELV